MGRSELSMLSVDTSNGSSLMKALAVWPTEWVRHNSRSRANSRLPSEWRATRSRRALRSSWVHSHGARPRPREPQKTFQQAGSFLATNRHDASVWKPWAEVRSWMTILFNRLVRLPRQIGTRQERRNWTGAALAGISVRRADFNAYRRPGLSRR